MERSDEGRERGVPNSTSSQMGQESPVKLPLAPIVSTPPDRRGNNATVSTRRGSSIFSPTQTLDHNPPHLNHLPPPQHQKEVNPDPDPAQTPTGPSTGNTAPNLKSPPEENTSTTTAIIRYRECQKNHAASMGGHVVDGCGEFMPSGDEGTPESLRCAACDCHRNFHRKETENHNRYRAPPFHSQTLQNHHQQHNNHSHGRPGPTMVNFGGGGPESSSEDLNVFQRGHAPSFYSGSKKRFRTKFSQEQKEKMHDLAERLGWRMQKQNDGQVQQFCNEVGVKRQVFKVWMHNNKQAMKKKQT